MNLMLFRENSCTLNTVFTDYKIQLSQKSAMGALPVLRAATDPRVLGGQYYGPGRLLGTRGYPELARSSRQSHDTAIQRRLWTASEELTGVTFPV